MTNLFQNSTPYKGNKSKYVPTHLGKYICGWSNSVVHNTIQYRQQSVQGKWLWSKEVIAGLQNKQAFLIQYILPGVPQDVIPVSFHSLGRHYNSQEPLHVLWKMLNTCLSININIQT